MNLTYITVFNTHLNPNLIKPPQFHNAFIFVTLTENASLWICVPQDWMETTGTSPAAGALQVVWRIVFVLRLVRLCCFVVQSEGLVETFLYKISSWTWAAASERLRREVTGSAFERREQNPLTDTQVTAWLVKQFRNWRWDKDFFFSRGPSCGSLSCRVEISERFFKSDDVWH